LTKHMYGTYLRNMKQLHFSVDEETARRLDHQAKNLGLSLSRYVATLVSQSGTSTWPEGYLEGVVGRCAGLGLEEPVDVPPEDVVL
jgi:hypothetical protein